MDSLVGLAQVVGVVALIWLPAVLWSYRERRQR